MFKKNYYMHHFELLWLRVKLMLSTKGIKRSWLNFVSYRFILWEGLWTTSHVWQNPICRSILDHYGTTSYCYLKYDSNLLQYILYLNIIFCIRNDHWAKSYVRENLISGFFVTTYLTIISKTARTIFTKLSILPFLLW